MLLVLGDQQKEHLALLNNVDEEVAKEFCRIAIEFIRNGINLKMYMAAASKLNVQASLVRNAVEGLMYLFSESSKLMINEIDFQDSIIMLAFPESLVKTLLDLYLASRKETRELLSKMSMDIRHYHNLEWRFDIQVASRALSYQTKPEILLRFDIREGEDKKVEVVQTDPVNLVHMTHVLEQALSEMKTAHCRRIARNIK